MKIQILQAIQRGRFRSNKDTNGGYGTVNNFGSGIVASLLSRMKNQTMNFPEILPAYTAAMLKRQGHSVSYAENQLDPSAELVLIQSSVTNIHHELAWARKIKEASPHVKVGFAGGMSSGNPDLYLASADFVIVGEVESALLKGSLADFSGRVDAGLVQDLDSLPFPDWSHLHNWRQRYGLLRRSRGRSLPIQGSRGCPMSCHFYCTYPLVQGRSFRPRSPENIVAEIAYLQKEYGVSLLLFRDPIFSLNMDRIADLCRLLLDQKISVQWICETHPRLLDQELIDLMARAGCIAIKLGIESGNLEVMKKSFRASADLARQEAVIRACERRDIDILGFYILGYPDDTPETVRQTIDYAISLNTYGAQFTVATPYPGTPWYQHLHAENEIYRLDPELEHYTQYQLVFQHPHLSPAVVERLKNEAYRRYYLRPGYFLKMAKKFLR